MNKSFNYALGERDELVKRVHDADIGIYATFVFGYDNDDERTVEQALQFSKKHNFYTAAFNHLLPFPNTRLYDRLKEENRLIYDKWWLADGDSAHILIAEDTKENRLIAVGGAVVRTEYLGVVPSKCACLTGLKIHHDYRGRLTFISRAYGFMKKCSLRGAFSLLLLIGAQHLK